MGKPVRSRPRRSQRTRFTRSEIRQMENLLVEKKDELDQIFFQNVTKELNVASGRAGSRAIQMEQYQVQKWFQSKKRNQATEVTSSPNPLEEFINISDTSHSNSAPESSSDLPKDTGEKVPDETNLEFEARSSRDGAWYDVATFLTHRVLSSGELVFLHVNFSCSICYILILVLSHIYAVTIVLSRGYFSVSYMNGSKHEHGIEGEKPTIFGARYLL
ncbi:protein SAWADEE HOMEODOMAIN HOMOLOG 1 isoform X3 [Phoenix dactylifera]|uniref:Protein SAWADEE HOMEODOMAIN HOMOLOG 1 isoform X3 n=1 Tax=Phoenix dactylifera TaxID=42345 RepID=A0A8B9AW46_PHODC|nr:protein SAWADEE HOMEODOMAIN HOMOLOG 1 isoform X3 [Phoenix dactylifera]